MPARHGAGRRSRVGPEHRPAYGIIVCTVAGTSGQYSVRVQNTGAVPLARPTGVRLDAGGHAAGEIGVSLTDIAPEI